MITKVKVLKNVGKFYNYAAKGPDLQWGRNTFVYAPNAYGKTTLVHVLRSLRDNEPQLLMARKTLGATSEPEVIINSDDEKTFIFRPPAWNMPLPDLVVFDTTFIHDNILTQEISHEHKKSIHKIIIGETGVLLAREVSKLKAEEKSRRQDVDLLEKTFQAGGLSTPISEFLTIPEEEETVVDDRVAELNKTITAKQSEEKVKEFGTVQVLLAPTFDLADLKKSALQTLMTAHNDAEKRVRNHIATNIKNESSAKDFIRRGLDQIVKDCPFCGQGLNNSAALLEAYRQYFDDSFHQYIETLGAVTSAFNKWNLDNELTRMISTHQSNLATIAKWGEHLGPMTVPDIETAVNRCGSNVQNLRAQVSADLECKLKDPSFIINVFSLDQIDNDLHELNTVVEKYNEAVNEVATKIREFLAKIAGMDIGETRRELSKQKDIQTRFKPGWKAWIVDYNEARRLLAEAADNRRNKEIELTDYTGSIFTTYEERLNQILTSLGTDFRITGLAGKTDNKSKEPYSDFAFLILDHEVPLTGQDGSPSFKNTLSEGDRSTLALAFFIAALERSPDLATRCVIFDDPLSSLDETRREATARLLRELSPKVAQLCVFTHKKDFLWMLVEKIAEYTVLQIRSARVTGSSLESFDVLEDMKGKHARLVETLQRYAEEDFGAPEAMQANIRLLLETVIKTKYYGRLADGIKTKQGLGTLLETLFKSNLIPAEVRPDLMEYCCLANGPHHGSIVDAPTRTLSRDEVVTLIPTVFGLVEKL